METKINKIRNLYIFQGINDLSFEYFKLNIKEEYFKKGDIILQQGDESNGKAYIILDGSVTVIKDNQNIAILKDDGIFGEIALITNEKRNSTIIAHEDVDVIVLDKDNFLMLYKQSENYKDIHNDIVNRINNYVFKIGDSDEEINFL